MTRLRILYDPVGRMADLREGGAWLIQGRSIARVSNRRRRGALLPNLRCLRNTRAAGRNSRRRAEGNQRALTIFSTEGASSLSSGERAVLKQAGIEFVEFPDIDLEIADGVVCARTSPARNFLSFDFIYSALGLVRSGLTVPLSALCSQAGCILVDAHQCTRDLRCRRCRS